jgi:hypothetical protein
LTTALSAGISEELSYARVDNTLASILKLGGYETLCIFWCNHCYDTKSLAAWQLVATVTAAWKLQPL